MTIFLLCIYWFIAGALFNGMDDVQFILPRLLLAALWLPAVIVAVIWSMYDLLVRR